MTLVRARVVITGRVQGVFFRETAARRARSRGVAGWVRNLENGSVEAVFEGEGDSVESMIRFCREGPRSAEVRSVDVTRKSPEGESGFRVL